MWLLYILHSVYFLVTAGWHHFKPVVQLVGLLYAALVHPPPLEGIDAQWVLAQQSRRQPILFDTKRNKMAVAILNSYGSFLSSSTQ